LAACRTVRVQLQFTFISMERHVAGVVEKLAEGVGRPIVGGEAARATLGG
jgi:hypothetical protein